MRQQHVRCILVGMVTAGCYLGAEAESTAVGRGPYQLDSVGVMIALAPAYKLRDRPTTLCLGVDTARYVLDDVRGHTLRPRRPSDSVAPLMVLEPHEAADSTRIVITGVVVTARGERFSLRSGGYIFGFGGGDQYVCLLLPEIPPGTEFAGLQLKASRPVTADSVLWHVIVS